MVAHTQQLSRLQRHIGALRYKHAKSHRGSAAAISMRWLRQHYSKLLRQISKSYNNASMYPTMEQVIEVIGAEKIYHHSHGAKALATGIRLTETTFKDTYTHARKAVISSTKTERLFQKYSALHIKTFGNIASSESLDLLDIVLSHKSLSSLFPKEDGYFRVNNKGREYIHGVSGQNISKRVRQTLLHAYALELQTSIKGYDLNAAHPAILLELARTCSVFNKSINTDFSVMTSYIDGTRKDYIRNKLAEYLNCSSTEAKLYVNAVLYGSTKYFIKLGALTLKSKASEEVKQFIKELFLLRKYNLFMVLKRMPSQSELQYITDELRSEMAITIQTKEHFLFTRVLRKHYGDRVVLGLHDGIYISGHTTTKEIQSLLPSYLSVECDFETGE